MKPYLRSASTGQVKTTPKEEFDDSVEGSLEPAALAKKREEILLQKTLHAAKKAAKDHARSQGSLMATLVRRSDRTLHTQLAAKQLEINKYKASSVREDRENRKFRKPTLFDTSMEREKDLELIHELSRSVSREDIKMLTQTAKECDDIVEPFLRFVQNNNNMDDYLLSINVEKIAERTRPASAKPSSTQSPISRQRPYSAAAATTTYASTTGPLLPNTTTQRVRPSLSAPKARPVSANSTGGVNLHLVKYDLTNMHSPRGKDVFDDSEADKPRRPSGKRSPKSNISVNKSLRRPSMSDSIDSNMLHLEETDYFTALRSPEKPSALSGRGEVGMAVMGPVSAASAAHQTAAGAHVAVQPSAAVESNLPLNIHIDLPSISVSKYVHASADYSPDSRLSLSPWKTPLSSRRVKSAGAAGALQRPPLHHNYNLQSHTTASIATNNSSSMVVTTQASAISVQPSALNNSFNDESGVVLSESRRELSDTLGADSHREIFGYTPAASMRQLPEAVSGGAGAVKRVTLGATAASAGGGGSPEGIAADIINDPEEDDPFLLDELLLLPPPQHQSSPTLSHSKSRRILPAVELYPRHTNAQLGVDDAVVCAFMRSEMSPTKKQQHQQSAIRPHSATAASSRSPLTQRLQQPRWK